MIDHVTIRVPDLDEAVRFYGRAIELVDGPTPDQGSTFPDWGDFSLTEADDTHPVTERLHIGFRADSTRQVDDWWHAMVEAGYPSDGEPGPRPQYSPDYYGAFVLDAAGNSVEAMTSGPRKQSGVLDHLWLRSGDLEAMTRFYETVSLAGHYVTRHEGRTAIRGDGATFSIVGGAPTVGLHLAFAAPDQAAVDAFHRAGVEAGYASNGAPGERPEYHPGYYGAFLLDPNLHNIEAVHHGSRRINVTSQLDDHNIEAVDHGR
jgi:catechol 2,3-dioxygenase-like lactoylglutathione lyase family enzyme